MEEEHLEPLEAARRDYWRDKPFRMGDIELMEEILKSEVKAEDVVRMIEDYNKVLGPKVDTCVCVLCNDFSTEDEGTFENGAKNILTERYDVGCTKKEWDVWIQDEKVYRVTTNQRHRRLSLHA